MNANKREYQIQIFIRVHWRLFAVLLARLYPIEIDFDDSKWWCPPRSGCFFTNFLDINDRLHYAKNSYVAHSLNGVVLV